MLKTILLFIILSFTVRVAHADTLKLAGSHDYKINQFKLNNNQKLWLTKKQNITIGVYLPLTTPLSITSANNEFSGVDAEYLTLLKNTLNRDLTITSFKDVEQAYTALSSGEIDLLIDKTPSGYVPDNPVILSHPFLYSYPVLITRRDKMMNYPARDEKVHVAIANNYPGEEFIRTVYKNAIIDRYQSAEEALLSVANGISDLFIGDKLEADYYLSNEFYHELNQVKAWGSEEIAHSFVINKNNPILAEIINNLIFAIPSKMQNEMIEPWIDAESLPLFDGPLQLTQQEKLWLESHKEIRVIISPYNFPYSMTDSNGDLRGIAGDLLEIIKIKTGINIIPVYSYSNTDARKIVRSGKWDLLPAATYSPEREKTILFSRPFLSTPFVIVLKKGEEMNRDLSKKMTIAIPAYNVIQSFVKDRYHNITIKEAANSSDAIRMLQNGDVDAAISTKLTARYFYEHYESNDLTYYPVQEAPAAEIAFAMPADHYILREIFDKALLNISQKQIRQLANQWTDAPNPNVSTWNIYKDEFYQLLIFSTILILSSLLWGGYLLREAKRRKISESNLKDQLKFSSTLTSSVPYPLYIITLDGEVINSNPAFKSFFSSSEMFKPGAKLTKVTHPLFQMYRSMRSVMMKQNPQNNVVTITSKISNGTEFRDIVHWFTTFSTIDKATPLLICGWSDVTEHYMLMDALRRESDNAVLAKQAKGEFLARMSHELRTPVSAIVGFLELIQIDHPKEENVELAFMTGKNLLNLIGEVLDLEKIESGNYAITEEWMDISVLLSNIISMFKPLAFQKGLNVILRTDIPNGTSIWSDPQAIHQILSNLIGNAIKFTKQGVIILEASILPKRPQQNLLIMNVVDAGEGIPKEEQDKLFKLFSQTSSAKDTTGSGLGLFICKEIVQILKGQIYLSNSGRHGSKFTVEIPVKTSFKKGLPAELPFHTAVAQERKDLTILVADDNPTNRVLITKQLTTLGYASDSVADGWQALQALQKKRYDLLITDLNMPVLDGVELTKNIRNADSEIVIWGLTANARMDEKEQCLQSGMNLLLFKPLKIDELASLLHKVTPHNTDNNSGPLLDIDLLTSLAMGSADTMVMLLEHSRSECQKDITAIFAAADIMDRPTIKKLVHRINGTVQIMGVTEIMSLCEALEESIFENHSDEVIMNNITNLTDRLSVLIAEIETTLSNRSLFNSID